MKAVVYSFTRRGAMLSINIGEALQKFDFEVRCLTMPKFAEEKIFLEAMDDHNKACEYAFKECQLIVFVGAVGIAVRTIAPYIKNKLVDPAVLSVDEGGNFVIPLLSGHIGGANGFAKALGKDPDERIVWESTRSIATKLNLSPTTVGECIKHLESAGLLKVQRAKGKPTVICVLHDLKDNEDRFGLEDEEDEEFDDSELEWLPNYAKDAIRAWREEDTEDEDSEQRELVDDGEDRGNSRSSTLPDDEDSFFDIDNIPF